MKQSFAALAEHFEVRICNVSSLATRIAAIETIATAIAYVLRGDTGGPSFDDISSKATQINSDGG